MVKIIKRILMLFSAIILIFVIPLGFYNALVDPAAIGGGSIIFLIIPVIITVGVGIFALYKFIQEEK